MSARRLARFTRRANGSFPIEGVRAAWLGVALLLTLPGCDDGAPPIEVRDAAPPDASSPSCDVLVAPGELALRACDGRASVVFGEAVVLDDLGFSATLNGRTVRSADFPQSVWRRDGEAAQGRFFGRAGVPDLEVRVQAAAGALQFELTVSAGAGLELSELVLLSGRVPGSPRVLERSTETGPGPPASDGSGRRDEQLLLMPDRSVLVANANAALGGVEVWIGGETEAIELVVEWDEPPVTLGDEPYSAPPVALRVGEDPIALLEAHAEALRGTLSARPVTGSSPTWGWRSGAAFGPLVNAELLQSQADALRARMPDIDADVWVVADGLWFASLGDWRPRQAAFPDGFESIIGARLGLAWPALLVAERVPLTGEQPGWRLPDTCGDGCDQLDDALPSVRDHLERAALDLVSRGVAGLELRLGRSARRGAFARRALVVALSEIADLSLSADGSPIELYGPLDYARFTNLQGASAGSPCSDDATQGPSPECDGALRAVEAADAEPAAPDAVRRVAFALAHRFHHARLVGGDPGAVRVAEPLSAGQARQWATLAALAGGLYLLGDPVESLDDARLEIYAAPLRAWPLGPARPVELGDEDPPSVWTSTTSVAVFNWTDADRAVALPAALEGPVVEVFEGRAEPRLPATVEVPAHDVVVFRTGAE